MTRNRAKLYTVEEELRRPGRVLSDTHSTVAVRRAPPRPRERDDRLEEALRADAQEQAALGQDELGGPAGNSIENEIEQ